MNAAAVAAQVSAMSAWPKVLDHQQIGVAVTALELVLGAIE